MPPTVKEISDELAALNDKHDQLREDLTGQLQLLEQRSHDRHQETDRKLDDILVLLTGNGEPSKGLIVRVDRLEQSEKRHDYRIKMITGAVLSVIVGVVGKWIHG